MESSGKPLHVRLLGQFSLRQGDQPISGLEQPRLQALLGYLIAHRQAPLTRVKPAFDFWPDSSEGQALTNLRHLIHRLYQTWPESRYYLVADYRTIWWHPQAPWSCDLAAFDEHILRASEIGDEWQERQILAQAIEEYSGEFLPGIYYDWILQAREHIQERYQLILERMVFLLESVGDYYSAIHYAERLLRIDPLNEASYRWLIHLHYQNGNRSAAVHVFHQCSRILQRELAVQPSGLTKILYEQVLREPGVFLISLSATGEFNPPLVGRKSHWQSLLTCWRGVATGTSPSQCVLISGEAGIGKTSLIQAFMDWVQRQGGTAWLASCQRNGKSLPFASLVSWLKSFSLSSLPATWLRELSSLSPELLDMPQPHVQSHETGQRLRLFQALAHATLLQDQPILLGLDDAHWADGDSLDWLLFLLRNNPRTRLMVILTRCTGDSEPSGQLFQVCNELQRNSRLTEIILGRLDRSEAETLANRLGGRPFAETTLDFLYEFSEGNPLFIVEAIRMHDLALREAKQAGLARIKVSLKNLTSSMQARLSDRLAYLSPAAAQTLEIAAVIGRTFQADTIMSAGFYDEEPLLNSLDELMSRALILELDQKEYTFEHELLRQFVYDRMSHRRREYLHRRVAEALR